MNPEKIKEEIRILVQKYERIKNSGEIKKYNEEMTKKDFILPLFEILGWDVTNKNDDEVTAEETISRKRVDYAFRFHSIPKFFLEAKGINENINDRKFIDQAINYSWLKGVTWAVLTNFEKIKVFNTEVKAKTLQTIQFFELDCENYENSEQLLLLSKESFEKGTIDEKAEFWGKKLPKKPVDERLFSDLVTARDMLSKNIIKDNKTLNLTNEQVEEIIQRIISRLIFIRTLEDREYEEPLLQQLIREKNSKSLQSRLNLIFRQLDKIYDAKLFAPHLCEDIEIVDYPLKTVIENLYESEEQIQRYNFDILDSDILGGIYEQYLGVVTGAKKGNSMAHRKQEGIYYTPKYIVDYIIKTIFKKLNENKISLDQIKILDPACGSGSFLIKVYDYLLSQTQEKKKIISTEKDSSDSQVGYDEKIRIIQKNIFGVDLDSMAIEIAQLNLLLKSAEKKQHLPILKDKLKAGNSLIDDKKIVQNFAFDWRKEFPEVLEDGGFDVIVGNPPYIRNTELPIEHKEFYKKYKTSYKQYDIYVLFFEMAINLLKNGGFLGFITSNKFLASDYGLELRKLILEKCKIVYIVDVSHLRIFKDALTYPVITILQREENEDERKKNFITFRKIDKIENLFAKNSGRQVLQSEFMNEDNRLLEDKGDNRFQLAEKIKINNPLIKTLFNNKRGTQKNKLKISKDKKSEYLTCVKATDVDSFYAKSAKDSFVMSDLQKNILSEKKILLPRTVLKLEAAYDEGGRFIMDRIYYLTPKDPNLEKEYDLKYIVALLNSKIIDFYYKTNYGTTHVSGGYLDLRGLQIDEIPIKKISIDEQRPIAEIVDKIISLRKDLEIIGDKKTDAREKKIESLNILQKEIDDKIFNLYNINEDEKELILENI